MLATTLDTANVLLVDDDEKLLESLSCVLRKEPYVVVTASSVERAKRLLVDERIDVIVCDEQMPAQNGIAFLADLKDFEHPAVRIVLSGAGLPAAERAASDACVFRFLAKPCSSREIAAAIRDAIAFSFECSTDPWR